MSGVVSMSCDGGTIYHGFLCARCKPPPGSGRSCTSALGRKQPFRTARKHQSSAHPYPSRGVCHDSTNPVRLGQFGWLVCRMLSGWISSY